MIGVPSALAAVLTAGSLIAPAFAHPGEHHDIDEVNAHLSKRSALAANIQRSLDSCQGHPEFEKLKKRGAERRLAKANELREKRGIDLKKPYLTRRHAEAKNKRDLAALETFETYNHNYTYEGYNNDTSYATLFAQYKNVSCILTPEVTEGPYYVVGEYYRTDVVEDQEGVPVHLEYQYIDVSTCGAATGLYLETWQANATGVYSGVEVTGNGVGSADPGNLNNTFLRGVTHVNDDGYASFETLFVGHYEGRASHIHLIAQQNGTVYANGTYGNGTISHVGQLFFPTDLKDVVEATYPYSSNTQAITTNDEDQWAPTQADNDYDPFPDYAYLGDNIEDGLIMWISIGINMSAEYTIYDAAILAADGGHQNPTSFTGASGGSSSGSSSNSTGDGGSMNGTMSGSGNGTEGGMGGSAPSGSSGTGTSSETAVVVVGGSSSSASSSAATTTSSSTVSTSSTSSTLATSSSQGKASQGKSSTSAAGHGNKSDKKASTSAAGHGNNGKASTTRAGDKQNKKTTTEQQNKGKATTTSKGHGGQQ